MKKVIVRHNPSVDYPMYLEKLLFEKGSEKLASIGHTFTSNKKQAMVFDNDDYLGTAIFLLNLHKDKKNKKYEYSVEDID